MISWKKVEVWTSKGLFLTYTNLVGKIWHFMEYAFLGQKTWIFLIKCGKTQNLFVQYWCWLICWICIYFFSWDKEHGIETDKLKAKMCSFSLDSNQSNNLSLQLFHCWSFEIHPTLRNLAFYECAVRLHTGWTASSEKTCPDYNAFTNCARPYKPYNLKLMPMPICGIDRYVSLQNFYLMRIHACQTYPTRQTAAFYTPK